MSAGLYKDMGLYVIFCLCNFQYIAMVLCAWAVQLKFCLRLTVADVFTIIYNVFYAYFPIAWNNDFYGYTYIWLARMMISPMSVMLCSRNYSSYLDGMISTEPRGVRTCRHGAHETRKQQLLEPITARTHTAMR